MEAYSINLRVARGGVYGGDGSNSVSSRISIEPNTTSAGMSFRIATYIQ